MVNNKSALFFLFFFTSCLFGDVVQNISEQNNLSEKETQDGVDLLLKEYQWGNMWEELTFDMAIKTCEHTGKNGSKKGMFGVPTTFIEPLFLVDVTTLSSEIKSLGISLGSPRPDKSGTSRMAGGTYVHITKFPLFYMLFKNSLNDTGFLAFDHEYVYPVYIGNIDPKRWNDILAFAMAPEKELYATIVGVLGSAATCPFYEALDNLSGSNKRDSVYGKMSRKIIDTIFYSVGCIGPVPTGTITTHDNPISTAILAISSVFTDLFSAKGVGVAHAVSHTTKNILNNYNKDVLCHPLKNPIVPMSQYTIQMLSPTTSSTHELGVNPLKYAYQNAKSKGDITTIFIVNQRRDYAAYAYDYDTKF